MASALRTRRPTGKPPWPLILLAGGEKTGKSWSAAAFSASELVGRTFFVELGEHYADEYGSIPGVRYEIVEHDGTYRDIREQITLASAEPREDGRPNCIIVDSMTLLWDLLSDEAQATANRRKNKGPDGEAQITMDLWNTAKKRWNAVLDVLRRHDGPVILTARLEQVAVMAANGQPTTEKALKVKAEKNLPYEVDVIVRIPEPRRFEITGLRSTRFQLEPGAAMPAPDFTVEELLRKLGLAEQDATAPRAVTPLQVAEPEEVAPQREQSTQPRPDEWSGPPRPPAKASDEAVRQLNIRIRGKFGPISDAERISRVSGFIQRRIASTSEVFEHECARMLKSLAELPDYRPPAAPVPLSVRQTEDPDAIAEAQALLPLMEADEADRLESSLRDLLESAGSPDDLEKAWKAVEARQAEQAIGAVHVMALRSAYEVRKAGLWTEAQQARRQAAERELVGAGARQPQEAGV